MSTHQPPTGSAVRLDLSRNAPDLALLLIVAALAWLWTVSESRTMGNMPGTMGLSIPAFLLMWGLMMTAMMLPSAAPTAALFSRTITADRVPRLVTFALGYLVVWTATGIPAYVLAWVADVAVDRSLGVALAAAIFVGNGVYQLTRLKTSCLSHCRTPISSVFHYASWTGRLREFRVGVHHGAYCLACCWSLMALMIAFGVMNLWAMVALAAVIGIEKLLPRGEEFSRAIGVISLGLAVLVFFVPEIAPGLTGEAMEMSSAPMGGM